MFLQLGRKQTFVWRSLLARNRLQILSKYPKNNIDQANEGNDNSNARYFYCYNYYPTVATINTTFTNTFTAAAITIDKTLVNNVTNNNTAIATTTATTIIIILTLIIN